MHNQYTNIQDNPMRQLLDLARPEPRVGGYGVQRVL